MGIVCHAYGQRTSEEARLGAYTIAFFECFGVRSRRCTPFASAASMLSAVMEDEMNAEARSTLKAEKDGAADPARLGRGIQDANAGIALVAGIQRRHGESLETIIRLVTPEQKDEQEGPTLEQLIGGLITRLDSQSAYLKDITVSVAKLARDMPLDVVQAISDNFGVDASSAGEVQR